MVCRVAQLVEHQVAGHQCLKVAGSIPATATKDFKICFHKQFFVMAFTRHRREVLTVLLYLYGFIINYFF